MCFISKEKSEMFFFSHAQIKFPGGGGGGGGGGGCGPKTKVLDRV